ncbi:hypothetical protein [Streptomyces sp. NPDC102282]|uniref:hypothetical protein n=1 Tax=Streptomyces sp. NPDC102282 TaxID=3366154 RepID=UPI0037F7116B
MAHDDRHEREKRRPLLGATAPEPPPGWAPHEGVYVDRRWLAALEAQVVRLEAQVARQGEEIQKLSGSRGRSGRSGNVHAEQLHEMSGRIGAQEREVRQMRVDVERGLGELHSRVAELDRLLDGVRGSRVQDAISSGELTSDLHRRHLMNAEAYRTLIAQNLRRLAVRLCPEQSFQSPEAMTSARAEAVAELLRILFASGPPGSPATAEELRTELGARGLLTNQEEVGPELGRIVERATGIARELTGDTLPATLTFDIDVRTLAPGAYEPYNPGATGVVCGFLVAPAYVIDGDQPEELLRPLVFIVPADASDDAAAGVASDAAERPDRVDRVA